MRPENTRYAGPAVALHWIVALLVVALVGIRWYMVDIPRGAPERASFYNLHKTIGLTAAFFVVLRLLWRWRHAPPALPASLAQWEAKAAIWSHRLASQT